MELQAIQSTEREKVTLAINGDERAYPNDRAGKRQAILEGLGAIETVQVSGDEYLSNNAALQVVAAVLYPAGIQTREAYELVCRVTEKACAHLGFGEEIELGPPQVPFAARGAYRKRYAAVTPQTVLDELALALTSRYHPRRETNRRSIWNKVAWDIYDRPLSNLTEMQQAQIQAQVDAIATNAGWGQSDDGADVYTQPLPINIAGARQRLEQYLQNAAGRPAPVRGITSQAQSGAYGRAFYDDELAPELETVVNEVLQTNGYQVQPEAGEYRPVLVQTPAGATESIAEALAALPTVNTDFGPALLLSEVLDVVKQILGVEDISEWQADQLRQTGILGQALRNLGFKTELTWCQPYHFKPPLESRTENGPGGSSSQQVLLKEVRVQHDPDKKLSLAAGLSIHVPTLTIDDEGNELVYLEMIGPKQSVRANWAALVGGGKVHWLGSRRVQMDGMKEHVRVQASLPCGWVNHILIHKQASLKEMNPEQPFYLLDNGAQFVPPLFYPMLNKALALPLLEGWTDYLWSVGREQSLIQLLDDGRGQGYSAWRVLPAADEWQQVVQAGLEAEQIGF